LEYEKFKEAAEFLKTKERERVKYVARSTESSDKKEFFWKPRFFDLINAFKAALKEVPKDIFLEVIKDEFTVEQKIHDLLHLLLIKDKISLNELFTSAKSKLEVVVTFLAILELIKLREIVAFQEMLFGQILVSRRDQVITARKKIFMQQNDRIADLWKENEEERIVNLSLRPVTLEDFVGQKNVISNLKIAIEAAKSAKNH